MAVAPGEPRGLSPVIELLLAAHAAAARWPHRVEAEVERLRAALAALDPAALAGPALDLHRAGAAFVASAGAGANGRAAAGEASELTAALRAYCRAVVPPAEPPGGRTGPAPRRRGREDTAATHAARIALAAEAMEDFR